MKNTIETLVDFIINYIKVVNTMTYSYNEYKAIVIIGLVIIVATIIDIILEVTMDDNHSCKKVGGLA